MSAIVGLTNVVRQLDSSVQQDEVVTPADAADATKLSRLFTRLLSDVADLRRRFAPRWVEFEDRVVDATGTTLYRFSHNFDGRARWWVVDWSGATTEPRLVRQPTSDNNTLVLVSYAAGTVTLRVEAAG